MSKTLDVAFHEKEGQKLRPVIIVSNENTVDIDVIAVSVSSTLPRNQFDIVIEFWKEAGLLKPSIARTSKIANASPTLLKRNLGTLVESDLEKVLDSCRNLF